MEPKEFEEKRGLDGKILSHVATLFAKYVIAKIWDPWIEIPNYAPTISNTLCLSVRV